MDCLILEAKLAIQARTSVTSNLAEALALLVASSRYDFSICGVKSNLYVLIVGDSSITHKSTATRYALSMCSNVNPIGTAADFRKQMTERRLEYYVSKKIMLHDDEFAMTMKNMRSGSQGYKIMKDLLNSAYDGVVKFPGNNRLRPKTVMDVKVGFVGSTTIEHFKRQADPVFLEGGLMKRMLVVIPGKARYRSRRHCVQDSTPQFRMERRGKMDMDNEAWEEHDAFMENVYNTMDSSMAGIWARAESQIFKIGALHAIDTGKQEVDLRSWTYAKNVVNESVTAHAVLKQLV